MENPISGNQGDVNFQFPAALDYFVIYSIVMLFQTHMLFIIFCRKIKYVFNHTTLLQWLQKTLYDRHIVICIEMILLCSIKNANMHVSCVK